jgi:formylglycine-generating enzyme required for sulfatase activity/serine/threonine protein kinase
MGAAASIHPTDQTLQAYGLGKLDETTADPVNRHLESCPDCQRRVAELSSDSFLGRLQKAQSATDRSGATWPPDVSSNMEGPSDSNQRPPAETMPPGLSDHPDYEVLRELGRGGMGVVYLAQNRLLGRQEVLKVMARHIMERPGLLARFLAEMRAVARLQHPNIVTAYSAFRLGESIVFAMEYVDGLDLAKLVKTKGPLPVAHACYFVSQAAQGMQHAHERGMVHRDIKPGNLMLSHSGNRALVKVLDFGLAKVTRELAVDGGLTNPGQALGTPDFMAPEQIRDAQKADIRADVYSLGCTVYYLLSGAPPFHAENLWDLYQAHHSMDAKLLNFVRPEVPGELASLVAKMMAKEPERRFQTPADVAQALTPFFKKGKASSRASEADVSQSGQLEGIPESSANRAITTQPEMNLEPSSAVPGDSPNARARPDPEWNSLIKFKKTEPEKEPVPASEAPRRPRPPRIRPAALAGLLLLGLFVAWAVVLRVKTASGIIELVNLPKDADVEVYVDGEEIAVTWPPGRGKPAVVTVVPGKHKIMVKKNGLEISGDDVTVQAEDKVEFTVRFVRATKTPNEQPKNDGVERTQVASKDPHPNAGTAFKTPSSPEPIKNSIATAPKANTDARPDAGPTVKTVSSLGSIKNSIDMTLNLIPDGKFMMGSTVDDKDAWTTEKPRHNVRISRPFYMGICEVTQEQFEAVMGTNSVDLTSTGQHPVTQVSWLDAVRFCNALSVREGLAPYYDVNGDKVAIPAKNGPGYRLPTEAEWEYACRAGTNTKYSFGDDASLMDNYGWHHENCGGLFHPVGQKRPNDFGLYDMHGHVEEWCSDVFDGGYYMRAPPVDPSLDSGNFGRVTRGGSRDNDPRGCRSASRGIGDHPWCIGFRLARWQSLGNKTPANSAKSVAPFSNESKTAKLAGEANHRVPLTVGPKPASSGFKSTVAPKLRGDWTSPTTKMAFVRIKGGEFNMGSPDDDKGAFNTEKPAHLVRISPFSLGVIEVTQAQYADVTGSNPSYFSSTGGGSDRVMSKPSDQRPVEMVSWLDAIRFCNALSKKDGLAPFYQLSGENVEIPDRKGAGYRLPTEAEWEFACRAGKTTKYSFGNDPAVLGEHGWFGANSAAVSHPVGEKRPNDLGLYDMHGNVWEWCSDGWDPHYYKVTPDDDPPGASGASTQVFRGGGWDSEPRECRSANRYRFAPGNRSYFLGFRVARGEAAR